MDFKSDDHLVTISKRLFHAVDVVLDAGNEFFHDLCHFGLLTACHFNDILDAYFFDFARHT